MRHCLTVGTILPESPRGGEVGRLPARLGSPRPPDLGGREVWNDGVVNLKQGKAMRSSDTRGEIDVTGPPTLAFDLSHFPLYGNLPTAGANGVTMPAESQRSARLVLSLFPGIDLFGRGFELEGFCIVRGPDTLWGGDVRRFHAPEGRFEGIIGGSPCQDFSRARRTPPTGEGVELLGEFLRIVGEAAPDWFLLENVPSVPTIKHAAYRMQRLDVRGSEVGIAQRRLRHFQFGSRLGLSLCFPRPRLDKGNETTAMASEGRRKGRRSWEKFCELQGLPPDFDLPGFTIAEKYKAVGNGVPVPMARRLAGAIRDGLRSPGQSRLCACGCGRPVSRKATSAGPACRKRLERFRKGSCSDAT